MIQWKWLGAIVIIALSANLSAEELLRTTTTWAGENIIYPGGQAEITSLKLKLADGETTPFHCHPVPTMGYVLKGTLEVETKAGNKTVLSEGQSAVEVFKTLHRGKAIGGPVEIIVFYAGATHIPNTVMPENDLELKLCQGN